MQARYLIGIYGQLDDERFEREWRPWFSGVELASLASQDEVERALALVQARQLEFGIHFPLRRSGDPGALHPLICSRDPATREAAFAAIRSGLEEAKQLGAAYLLIHFPKPVVLDDDLDWSDWRFAQPGEAVPANQLQRPETEAIATAACSRLVELATAVGLPLVLELDILHAWYYRGLLQQLFATHPQLGLCLDTGRLHMLAATDPGFDAIELIRSLLPHLTNLHLWTTRLGENRAGGHHPLLPELDGLPDWGQMGEMLSTLAAAKTAHVLFEHRSDLVSANDLERCYCWVAATLASQ